MVAILEFRDVLSASSPVLRTERSVALALQQFGPEPVTLLTSSSVGHHNDDHAAALREWLRCRGHGFVRLWAAWRSQDSATVRQQWLLAQGLTERDKDKLVKGGLTSSVVTVADADELLEAIRAQGRPSWVCGEVSYPAQCWIQAVISSSYSRSEQTKEPA